MTNEQLQLFLTGFNEMGKQLGRIEERLDSVAGKWEQIARLYLQALLADCAARQQRRERKRKKR